MKRPLLFPFSGIIRRYFGVSKNSLNRARMKNLPRLSDAEELLYFAQPVILRQRAKVLALVGRNEEAVKELEKDIKAASKIKDLKGKQQMGRSFIRKARENFEKLGAKGWLRKAKESKTGV